MWARVRLTKKLHDFRVARLVEYLIPESDGVEWLGRLRADDLVSNGAQPLTALDGPHRRGHDDPRRMMLAKREHGRFHRRSGRETIVDDDGRFALERDFRTTDVVGLVAPFELAAFTLRDLFDELRRNSKIVDGVVVEHLHAARGDGADREFRISGGAELSDQEHVERRLERSGDFEGNRNATSRKREYNDVLSLRVLRQVSCEVLPSFPPIPEAHTRQTARSGS